MKMSRSSPTSSGLVNSPLTAQAFMLATDLDGTFLAGDMTVRSQLYRMLSEDSVHCLTWVTGRGLEAVLPLLSDPGLPRPDYIICDVGATLIRTSDLQPIQPLQSEIESRWPGELAVVEMMSRYEDITRQDVPQQRRCSYFCDPELLLKLRPDIELQAQVIGCEVLYSANRYLDILPRNTNKGTTLQALISNLYIDKKRVLVAGDTLNDLSMYDQDFYGVCVGNSEIALMEATQKLTNVLHATEAGCGGILQAIKHFELTEQEHFEPALSPVKKFGNAELVMVYHRLPYEETIVNGITIRSPHSSPNGIIPSLLSFFGTGHPGSWVAWSVANRKDAAFQTHTEVDAAKYPLLTAARVPLTKLEVDIFYKRFAKEAFWPIINGFWERARFNEDHWKLFKSVNQRFAEVTAKEAAYGATIWLHDYNLWMVPATLRALRPDLIIAFFHHTHFPASDIFNILPWHREILGSLLACDYLGFHVPRHVENFIDTVRSAMPIEVITRVSCAPRFLTYGCAVGVDTMATEILSGYKRIKLGAHPIGTDIGRIRECLDRQIVRVQTQRIRDEIGDRELVLSIERLDYSKGILEKLHAFEMLFEIAPEMKGRVTLVMVCVPAAEEMTVYKALQSQIEQAVGRINGRYSSFDWTPVRFFARVLPFDEVVAHYAAADVMWITPLRDGLNLVAKEFIAVQGMRGSSGVLVLSEFAGAAAELKGALLTNPYDPTNLVDTLLQALEMSSIEREDRRRTLYEVVSHFDLAKWGADFLAAVATCKAQRSEPSSIG